MRTLIQLSMVRFALLAALLGTLSGCGGGGKLLSAKSWNPFVKQAPAAAPEPAKPEPTPELSADQKLDVQMTMVQGLERQGKYDEALSAYEEMHRKFPRRNDIVNRLAVLHDKKGEVEQADKYYRMAIERDPHNADILCDYGYSLYLRGDTVESERMLRKSLQRNPRLARAHNNLALLLTHTNRQEAALAEFSYAVGNEAQARVNLAHALMWDQQWPAAEQQFAMAMRADPTYKPAEQGLEKLRTFQSKHQAATAPVAPTMQANRDLPANQPQPQPQQPYMASQPTQPLPAPVTRQAMRPAIPKYQPSVLPPVQSAPPYVPHAAPSLAQQPAPREQVVNGPSDGTTGYGSFEDQVNFEDENAQSSASRSGVVSLAAENDGN